MALVLPLLMILAAHRAEGPWGVAYAPVDHASPRPAIVFLHGMWASPEDSCAPFELGATAFGFLLCPRGNAPLGTGRMWAGTAANAESPIRRAMAAAESLLPGRLDATADGTIIGYSNGAYFAAEVACAEPGRWTGLVLISMKLEIDPARLRSAGIRRVVLASGDHDGARTSMQRLADRLARHGVDATFKSLGPGGHEFPPDMDARMCEAIAWVRGANDDACVRGTTGP